MRVRSYLRWVPARVSHTAAPHSDRDAGRWAPNLVLAVWGTVTLEVLARRFDAIAHRGGARH